MLTCWQSRVKMSVTSVRNGAATKDYFILKWSTLQRYYMDATCWVLNHCQPTSSDCDYCRQPVFTLLLVNSEKQTSAEPGDSAAGFALRLRDKWPQRIKNIWSPETKQTSAKSSRSPDRARSRYKKQKRHAEETGCDSCQLRTWIIWWLCFGNKSALAKGTGLISSQIKLAL